MFPLCYFPELLTPDLQGALHGSETSLHWLTRVRRSPVPRDDWRGGWRGTCGRRAGKLGTLLEPPATVKPYETVKAL